MKFWLVGIMRVDYPVRKRDGGLSLLVFGGQLEEKEIKGVLKTNVALRIKVKIFVIGR